MWGKKEHKAKVTSIVFIIFFLATLSSIVNSNEEFNILVETTESFTTLGIEGPAETPFSITILDENKEIFSRTASTNSIGSYSITLPLEKGYYVFLLRSGNTVKSKEFLAGKKEEIKENKNEQEKIKDNKVFVPLAKKQKNKYSVDGVDSFGMPETETITGADYNISAYDTKLELIKKSSSPFSQKISYRLFNKREKDFSYVAITTSGKLKGFRAWHLVNKTKNIERDNITYYKGDVRNDFQGAAEADYMPIYFDEESEELKGNYTKVNYPYIERIVYEEEVYDEPESFFVTKNFLEKWESGWYDSIKNQIGSFGVSTDLNLLDRSVLPSPEQTVYLYRVPHQPGTWEYFEYETDNRPSKFIALDPGGGSWWNSTWSACKNITINNAGSTTLENFPAYVNVSFVSGKMQSDYRDIRFINTSCNNEGSELDYEIENYTSSSADVWVRVPSIPESGTTISMYYDNSQAENGENPAGVWDENYVVVQHMEEKSGTFYDSTEKGNNGTLTDSDSDTVRGAEAKVDGGVDFAGDANDDKINCGQSSSLDVDYITIEAWAKFDDNTGNRVIAAIDDGSNRRWAFYLRNGNVLRFFVFVNNGWESPDYSWTPTTGQWYHMVGIKNSTHVSTYLDGSMVGTPPSHSGVIDKDSADLVIGEGSYPGNFDGMIDEFRISNISRSAEWINQTYQMMQNQNIFVSWGDEETNLPPKINIKNPENMAYNYYPLNLSVSTGEDAEWCGWNLNNSGSNSTMSGSGRSWNSSITPPSENQFQIFVYCNDSDGYMGINNTVFFKYDTTPPNYSDNITTPQSESTYSPDKNYQFNITFQDTLSGVDKVWIEENMTGSLSNHTVPTSSGSEYYYNINDLGAGKYVYRWFANDTAGNVNSTPTRTYNIKKGESEVRLYLNGTENNITITYGEYANITATLNISQNFYVYKNGDQINSGYSPLYKITENFASGEKNITAYYGGNENYSQDYKTYFIKVNKKSPSLLISINPSETVSYETETNSSCSIIEGDPGNTLTLYRNNSQVAQGTDKTEEIKTLGASTYNYTCHYQESQNYTSIYNRDNFLNVTKKSTETFLWINGTRHKRGFTKNSYSNFTVELNGYPGKNIELWTNYSDGIWKLWGSGSSPLQNMTNLSTEGNFGFLGNYSGNENYTESGESWSVAVTLLELDSKIESINPTVIEQFENSTVLGNCSCHGGNCSNVFIEIQADGERIFNTTGGSLMVNGSNPVSMGDIDDGNWLTAKWNVMGIESKNYTIRIKCNSTETCNTFSATEKLEVEDSVAPKWSSLKNHPSSGSSFSQLQPYQFNVTWNDNGVVDKVIIEHNLTGSSTPHNTTIETRNNEEWYFDVSGLAAGTYVYRWFANDTLNNWNLTGQESYTVNKATPSMTINGLNVTYPENVNIQPSESNGGDKDINYTFWRENTILSSSLGVAPASDTKSLGAGIYSYRLNCSEGQNWTSISIGDSLIIEVKKGTSVTNLYLNGTEDDKKYTLGGYANFTVGLNLSGDVYLDTNMTGWILQSGSSPLVNYTILSGEGVFNITGYFNGDENYTSSYVTYYANVTQDIYPPQINWISPTPLPGEKKKQDWVYLKTEISDHSNNTAFFDWNRSLLGYWSFEYNSSTGIYDNSTHKNIGSFTGNNFGSDNITTGKFGKALEFDGQDDYIAITDGSEFNGLEELTLSAWIYQRGLTGSYNKILSKRGGSSNFWFIATKSEGLYACVASSGSYTCTDSYPVEENEWHHVVLTFKNSDQIQRVYYDGNLVLANSTTGSLAAFSASPTIGRDSDLGSGNFYGAIDEALIFDRALSQQEVRSLYDNKNFQLYRNFTELEDGNYTYTAWAIDQKGNMDFSSREVSIGSAPKFREEFTNSTEGGEPVKFSLRWTDDSGLSGYVFSFDNGTGTFSNGTGWTQFPTGGKEDWSNETRVTNSTTGSIIRWKVYANDTDGNWNTSDTYSFTVTEGFNISINVSVDFGYNSNILVYNSTGQMIGQGQDSLNLNVEQNQLYDIIINTPLISGNQKTLLKNVNVSQNINITSQVKEDYSGYAPVGISELTAIYSQEELAVGYEYAEIFLPRSGMGVPYILHCTEWNFTTSNCSVWEINESSDYQSQENSTHIWFNVTVFDSYGGGDPVNLSVILSEPKENTIVPYGKNFTVNATVICRGGDCGSVEGGVRFNSTSTNPDTSIPQNAGNPFYTFDSNPQFCTLSQGENCTMLWKVNSTGNLGDKYKLGVKFNCSSQTNHTENSTVEIGKILMMNFTFDTINFGVLDPGELGQPAKNNTNNIYNISIDPNSNNFDFLWIKSERMFGSEWPNYYIGPGNISWSFQNNPSTETKMSLSYSLMDTDIQSGQNLTTYYWIDVPYGLMNQNYQGTMTIKANATW